MSQPIGHLLMTACAMNRIRPDLLNTYPNFIALGALGPDWFYTALGGMNGYGEISDELHRSGSSIMYQSMLELAKEHRYSDRLQEYEETISFAHGFISHVIADCIFHPFVNRRANNAWEGEKHGDSRHAGVETVIDNLLLEKYHMPDFNLFCSDANRTGRVDAQILQCMFTGMKIFYSNSSWWNRICDRDLDDYHHPFNIAYRACFQWDSFSDMGRTVHFNSNALIQHLKGMTLQTVSAETGLNSARNPWCEAANNEMLIESSLELIDLSIRAIAEAISDGERYVEQNLSDFESSSIPFLTTDYNLDTGLPSAYNNEIFGNYRGEHRFTYKTDLLRENYDWASSLPALD